MIRALAAALIPLLCPRLARELVELRAERDALRVRVAVLEHALWAQGRVQAAAVMSGRVREDGWN